MNEEKASLIKLAGLWKQKGKGEDGKAYYSGSLSYSTNLLLFPNKYKENADDKKPDLILYICKKEKKEDKPKLRDPGDDEVPF